MSAYAQPHLGYWGKETGMWKFAMVALCSAWAIWAAHYVTGYDVESFFAMLVIAWCICMLFVVARMQK